VAARFDSGPYFRSTTSGSSETVSASDLYCAMPNVRHEARRNSRQRLRFQVKLGRSSCFTLNLGAGGFCTEMMHVLSAGSPVAGSIRVHGKDHPFSGRVAWAREGNARMNIRGRMGIVFEPAPRELLGAVAAAHSETPAVPARRT